MARNNEYHLSAGGRTLAAVLALVALAAGCASADVEAAAPVWCRDPANAGAVVAAGVDLGIAAFAEGADRVLRQLREELGDAAADDVLDDAEIDSQGRRRLRLLYAELRRTVETSEPRAHERACTAAFEASRDG